MVNSGVYKITNIENGKVYIGSSKNINRRISDHIYLLKKNIHGNTHLQRAWNKYGEDKFEFLVMEMVSDINILLEREQKWMDFYKCYERDHGYNIFPIAGRSMGHKHTEETKRIISETNKGKVRSEVTKRKMSYAQKGSNNPNYGKHPTEESKRKCAESLALNWEIISLNGETFIIKNLNSFCKEKGINVGCMYQVAKDKRKHHKGWKCHKIENIGGCNLL